MEDKEYVKYLTGRKYNADRKYSEPERVVIGRRAEPMPGLMYPSDNYEKYFTETGDEYMSGETTPEEEKFIRNNRTFELYNPFFEALYHEFRQQTRKKPDNPLNRFKAESLNEVLIPLREMMKDEDYTELLRTVDPEESGKENGMTNSDAMILLTQYKSALAKYRRNHT